MPLPPRDNTDGSHHVPLCRIATKCFQATPYLSDVRRVPVRLCKYDSVGALCLYTEKIPPSFPESNITGNEDCLFLNIFAPANKINLPVMVYIHGGGYGQGQANVDLTSIINMNKNSFIGVSIQYRVCKVKSCSVYCDLRADCLYSLEHSGSCPPTK